MKAINTIKHLASSVAKRVCVAVNQYHTGATKLPAVFKDLITHVARNTPLDTPKGELRKYVVGAVRLTFERAIQSDPRMSEFLVKGFNVRNTKHGPKADDPNYGFYVNDKGAFAMGPTITSLTYWVVSHMLASSVEEWCADPVFTQPKAKATKGTKAATKALAKGSKVVVDKFIDSLVDAIIYNDNGSYASKATIVARIKSLDLDKLHAVA
jgi:uncharacterized membrane protein (DUF485 family)